MEILEFIGYYSVAVIIGIFGFIQLGVLKKQFFEKRKGYQNFGYSRTVVLFFLVILFNGLFVTWVMYSTQLKREIAGVLSLSIFTIFFGRIIYQRIVVKW